MGPPPLRALISDAVQAETAPCRADAAPVARRQENVVVPKPRRSVIWPSRTMEHDFDGDAATHRQALPAGSGKGPELV